MIIGSAALFLNMVAVATVAFFFGVALVSAAGLSGASWPSVQAGGRRRLLWLAVSIPWLLAAGVSVFFLLSPSVDVAWVGRWIHWHHLDTFNVYSWHSYPSLLLLLIVTVAAIKTRRSVIEHLRAYHLLTLALNDDQSLESRAPQAFSAGFLVPKVFITTGLINQLTENELQIVRQHEQAHVECRDSLQKLAFSFLSSFFILQVAQSLRRAMSLCIEQCADEHAVSQGADRVDVAMTLLKVTRLMRAHGAGNTAALQCAFDDSEIKERVGYLLLSQPAQRVSLRGAGLIGVLLSAMVVLCLLGMDVFHHVIETLFNHV